METAKAVIVDPCPPISATIRPPGSKSITNRALVCAALARGCSQLSGVLDSEDTQVMIQAWQQLGLRIEHDAELHRIEIEGCGGQIPVSEATLFVANSGTTIRFLTAALAACHGNFVLDGVERMRQRPIGDLLRALQQLGGQAASLNQVNASCPPVRIQSSGLTGGLATIAGSISSQYLSGLMMASPLAKNEVSLEVEGELVSVPYVEMTAEVMRAFGASVSGPPTGPLRISADHRYRGIEYEIEPDASAASYFWAAAAIAGGSATVRGLSRNSLQGDIRFCEVLEQMGCHVEHTPHGITVSGKELQGIDVDMGDISDTVQTLAAVALFAHGPTTVRGVAHNRVKETDRITDLARELRKLGAQVQEFEDGLTITPPTEVLEATIETYNDHRMAMSLALVGLRRKNIEIRNPGCTAKTYPRYWTDLESFCQTGISRLD